MRSFLVHASLFGIIILSAIGGYTWLYREYLPAPRLTRNISLNEQLQRVKQIVQGGSPHSDNGRVNMLAAGSSMSLNNLNSRAVLEHFGDSNFVNVGSWSTRINHTTKLSASLIEILEPKTLLITSNMEDWMTIPDFFTLDTGMIRSYLTEWSTPESYLRTMRPSYYLREMERNMHRMTDQTILDFLGFDDWGGAAINVPPERVAPERNILNIPTPDQVDHSLYPYLEWLAEHLAGKGIELIYIQSPYRESDQTEELIGIIAAHEQRVQKVLLRSGHTFISTTDRTWPDELFIDPSHLTEKGAYLFTSYALNKLEEHDPGRSAQQRQAVEVEPSGTP